MDDLIKYLTDIRERLDSFGDEIPKQMIMEEISNIATNNWVENGKPDLTDDQFNKVILRVLSRGTTLN